MGKLQNSLWQLFFNKCKNNYTFFNFFIKGKGETHDYGSSG